MDKTSVLVLLVLGACSKEEERLSQLEVDYSREAREELQNGLFAYFPKGLDDYDILGWSRDDLPQSAEYSLLRFPEAVNRDDAIDATRRTGYRPANFDELLVYARENRQTFGQNPVFAAGTVWKNRTFYPYVPYIYRAGGGIGLGLWFAWNKLPADALFLSIKIQDN